MSTNGKAINELTALTTAAASDNTKLLFVGIAANGQLFNITVQQAKAIYSTQKAKYVATGSEGSAVTIPAIAGMAVLLVVREGSVIEEGSSAPDPAEYFFNGLSLTFGTPINAGERITVLYKYA